MSSHASKKINQKEYLKKYLSGDTGKKKKKKDKTEKMKRPGSMKVKIIDDDIGVHNVGDIDEELLLTGEDAPQIVGEYVEERPNASKASKWRSIAVKEEMEGIELGKIKKESTVQELWGHRAGERKIKDEVSPSRKGGKRQSTPDFSHLRHRDRGREVGSLSSHAKRSRSREDRRNSSKKQYSRKYSLDQSPQYERSTSSSQQKKIDRQSSSDQSPMRRKPRFKSGRRDRDQSHERSRDGHRPTASLLDHSPQRRHHPKQSREVHMRDSSSDQSPPRRRSPNHSAKRKAFENVNQSPTRNCERNPPRRGRSSSSDQSPQRHRKLDLSSKRRPSSRSPNHCKIKKEFGSSTQERYNSDQCSSKERTRVPPRPKLRNSSEESPRDRRNLDLSPPRRFPFNRSPNPRSIKRELESPPRHSRWKPEPSRSLSPPPTHKPKSKSTKTLDGKKAGLQDAQSLKTETEERRRAEERMFAQMSSEVSGRYANVAVRTTGRRGQRARDAAAEDPETRRRKEENEKKYREQYERWGKGLKQVEMHRARMAEEEHERSKPLARYSNDEDLERHLREQERAGDPMLEYMRRKKKDLQKEGNASTVPIYEGPFPENRYGIRPGYRWDGVDRSNGFEKKWFAAQNEKRALREEAYKYSVEDM